MSDRGDIAGLILAGGRSSRFGTDKAMALLGGQSLLEITAARLAPQVRKLAVSGHTQNHQLPSLPLLADPIPERGPLGGILAGLEWLEKSEMALLVSTPVDTPFFPVNLVERLAGAARQDRAVICSQDGRLQPAFALWPLSVLPILREAIRTAPLSLKEFALEVAKADIVDFPEAPQHSFFNINTVADLQQAENVDPR